MDTAVSQTLQDADQGAHRLDRRDVVEMFYALDVQDRVQLIATINPLHPEDIADLLEQIKSCDLWRLIRLYERKFDREILTKLQEGLRKEIIRLLKPDILAEAVRDLETDDVVDLIEDHGFKQQRTILEVLEDSDRLAVESALNYPEYSAGRLMQRKLVTTAQEWKLGNAIDRLRASDNLPEKF